MTVNISQKIIHFIKPYPDTVAESCRLLAKIMHDKRLEGCGRATKGNHSCVCFTEAPLKIIANGGFLNSFNQQPRYSRYGLIFDKTWLFEKGGRPVIYQADSEYNILPESHKWRHVRYEPSGIDFTWEREWRIKGDIDFDMNVAGIVIPSNEDITPLKSFCHDIDMELTAYSDELDICSDTPLSAWRVFPLSEQS